MRLQRAARAAQRRREQRGGAGGAGVGLGGHGEGEGGGHWHEVGGWDQGGGAGGALDRGVVGLVVCCGWWGVLGLGCA